MSVFLHRFLSNKLEQIGLLMLCLVTCIRIPYHQEVTGNYLIITPLIRPVIDNLRLIIMYPRFSLVCRRISSALKTSQRSAARLIYQRKLWGARRGANFELYLSILSILIDFLLCSDFIPFTIYYMISFCYNHKQ